MDNQELLAHHRRQLGATPDIMAKALRTPLDQYLRWESGEEEVPGVVIFAAERTLLSLIRYLQRYDESNTERVSHSRREILSRNQEIFRLASSGVRQTDIAKKLGLTQGRVWQILNDPRTIAEVTESLAGG